MNCEFKFLHGLAVQIIIETIVLSYYTSLERKHLPQHAGVEAFQLGLDLW